MALSNHESTFRGSTGSYRPPSSPQRPSTSSPPEARSGVGAGALLLLVPLACCGLPVLLALGATLGVLGAGLIGGGFALAVVAVLGVVWARRRRANACCDTPVTRVGR